MKNTKKRSERKRNFLQLSHRNDIDRGKVRKENRAAVLEREGEDVTRASEKERAREKEHRAAPSWDDISPWPWNGDWPWPCQPPPSRSNASRLLPLHWIGHPTAPRVASYYANAMLLGASGAGCCCCGCGHRCCIDRPQHRLPAPSSFTPRLPGKPVMTLPVPPLELPPSSSLPADRVPPPFSFCIPI